MKTQVTVNGVTLSRAQVEAALKDLNTPDPLPAFKVGDIVRVIRGTGFPAATEGVVVGGNVAELLEQAHGRVSSGWVRFTNGHDSWTVRREHLILSGSIGRP